MPTPEAAGTAGFWTEGNPALGVEATRVRASFLNGLQQECLNVLAAASITPSKTTYDQLLTAILKIAGGSARVKGLVGANNSGTPNTQFDFTCASVDMRDPTTGAVFSVTSPASKTCNISTAGPAANGRDQAGAFTASSWVHFYYIFNPTTGSTDTLASASASAPAALPIGYTAWAYVGAVVLTAGSALNAVKFRGAWATYDVPTIIVSGAPSVSTPFSTSELVPPNALEWKALVSQLALSANGSGAYSETLYVDSYEVGLSGAGAASAVTSISGGACILPNIGNSANFRVIVGSGSGPSASIKVQGYKLPNGGE